MTQMRFLFPLSLFFLICFNTNSQQLISSQEYDSLKLNGAFELLNGVIIEHEPVAKDQLFNQNSRSSIARSSVEGCGCYIEPDTSYTLAMQPNDDGSQLINFPFSFCFYGTQYSSLYINNNGNVSFGLPYTTFSGVGFPSNQFVMIAPFWGDVDTRGAGEVWYKVDSNYVIINWVDVGYYDSQTDKRNTFQLILSDGTDSLLTGDNNVGFCYRDMEWTTGSASNGQNGFGGTPATVGANKGDSVQFVQFGRFDAPGTTYNGPYDTSEVSWLNDQSFYFNACNSINIPPVLTGLNQCDTINSCVGDTFTLDISVLSPEQGQITQTQILSAPPSFVVTGNTTGNSSDVSGYLVGAPSNAGYNVIELMSYDNGMPADTIYTSIVIYVDLVQFPKPNIVGDTIVCFGDTTSLSILDVYESISWSSGDTTPIIGNVSPGVYTVTGTVGFCSKKDTHTVDVQVLPQPNITGDTEFCEGGNTTLSIADTFDVFTWSTGDLTEDIVVDDSITVKVVVEKWNCENVDSVSLIINPLPEATITGDTFYCLGASTVLSVQNFAAYEWNNGSDTRSILATEGDYYCLVTDAKGCQAYSDTVQVIEIDPNEQIFGDTTICIRTGNLNTLNGADGNAVYAWSTGDTAQEITVGVGEYQLVVVDSMGCFDSSSVEVIYITTPVTNFSIDPDSFTVRKLDVQFTDLTMLDSGFIETYYWTFDQLGNEGTSDRQNPVYAYQNEGLVEVTLTTTADNGCKSSLSKDYLVLREIPTSNVITPNGDGVNDVLYFKRLEHFPNSELTIYNRWGSVVYSTSDYRNDWDGDNLSEGVYYYVLKVSKINQVHKGSITILK